MTPTRETPDHAWQPIKTAPKNQELRLWGRTGPKSGWDEFICFWSENTNCWRATYSGVVMHEASHWRPKAKGPK